MEVNKNPGIKKVGLKSLGLDGDIILEKVTEFLLRKSGSFYRKCRQNHSSQPMMNIRDFRHDATIRKELSCKFKQMLIENSSNLEERSQLFRKMISCVQLEKRRNSVREAIASNRRQSILKKVWANRELPVDKECLASGGACKDVFDMSSLSESLLLKPVDDIEKKAERLTKEFLLYAKQKKENFIRAEKARLLASNACELNKNLPSSSLKVDQPPSLSSLVKKVCNDEKHVHILSFKPLLESQSGSTANNTSISLSCPELQDLPISHKEPQNLDGKSKPEMQIKGTVNKLEETIALSHFPDGQMLVRRHKKQKNKLVVNSKLDNKFLLKNQCPDRKHNSVPRRLQSGSGSLCRQLRRLTLEKSKEEIKTEGEIKKNLSNKNNLIKIDPEKLKEAGRRVREYQLAIERSQEPLIKYGGTQRFFKPV